MENHPIPQDVTSFQFKLIGNMTVKQFAYLASGIVLAALIWQLPVNVLIKFPFCSFLAILGTALAYFPVSGRPMDLMIENYIKALINPTQYIYEKVGGQIYYPNLAPIAATKNIKQYGNAISPFPKDKLKAYIESLNTQPKSKIDEKENNFLMSVSSLAMGNPVLGPQPIITPIADVSTQSEQSSPTPAIKKQADIPIIAPQPIPMVQPVTQPILAPIKPTLRSFSRTASMPSIPDSPNLITGITKDARGNALSNILVEVRDKDNNPVRAFKTNEFGRFASATPLTNGTYTIEFEDPKAQNRFEKIVMNIDGKIITPIEAGSIDDREELRKSLFSTQVN